MIRSDDTGDAWWRAETQAACCARSHLHQFQAYHFLGYDPAGGFPSPPTAYQRGRRAQNLSRSRTLRAREGLTFTSSSTMAFLERRVEIPVYGRIGHDQQPVPIAVPSQAARVVMAIGAFNRLAVRFIIGQASRTETRMGGDAPFARLRGAPSAP